MAGLDTRQCQTASFAAIANPGAFLQTNNLAFSLCTGASWRTDAISSNAAPHSMATTALIPSSCRRAQSHRVLRCLWICMGDVSCWGHHGRSTASPARSCIWPVQLHVVCYSLCTSTLTEDTARAAALGSSGRSVHQWNTCRLTDLYVAYTSGIRLL